MDAQECPHCGRPMERVDDFWFCDNDDCPRKREPVREEPPPKGTEARRVGPRPVPPRNR